MTQRALTIGGLLWAVRGGPIAVVGTEALQGEDCEAEETLTCQRTLLLHEQYSRSIDRCVRARMSSGVADEDCRNTNVYGTAAAMNACIDQWENDCACGEHPVDVAKCMAAQVRACARWKALALLRARGQ